MAVNIGTELVNNGNSGWNNLDVMTALEKVFSEMGWNSGTQKNGVPISLIYPGGYTNNTGVDVNIWDTNVDNRYDATPTVRGSFYWGRCGGPSPAFVNPRTRYIYVTNNGTTSYEVSDWIEPSWSVNSNIISTYSGYHMGDNLITGTKLTYNGGVGGNGGATEVLGGLSSGNVYYMRRITSTTFTLHPTSSDAQNDTNIITVTSNSSMSSGSDVVVRFQTDAETNPTIQVGRGDRLYFYTYDITQGNFRVCDFSVGSSYAADRTLHDDTNLGGSASGVEITGDGTYTSPFYWQTGYYYQTENEVLDPTQISGTGYTGIVAYGYANDSNTGGNLKGQIIINPQIANTSSFPTTYWKYTVTGQSGDDANAGVGNNGGTGRTDLKLRIYRDDYSSYRGQITGILICNQAENWKDNDKFTIPGTAIGGTSPTNDIVFGENNYISGDNNTPNILTTNLGAGANMFQKSDDGRYGVLRLENDSTKKFGVTYWGFALSHNLVNSPATGNELRIQTGSGWSYLNRLGKHYAYNSSDNTNAAEAAFGAFNGDMGLDYQYYFNSLHSRSDTYNDFDRQLITTSNGGHNYPLKIRYYKAQAPQDTNFAVIQFLQTDNGVDKAWFTFTIHKGTSFGTNVWDLDEVWNGTYTYYDTYHKLQGNTSSASRGRWVSTNYTIPGYNYSSGGPIQEPPEDYSIAREASYGYMRSGNSSNQLTSIPSVYVSNIDYRTTNNSNEIYTYYRNSTYDKISGNIDDFQIKADWTNSVGVNYYKPIKGIPICNQLSPCPYYMPDDFVFIQAEVTPGSVEFAVGDTVTIDSSESYTVIIADNQKDQNGLDSSQPNSFANGMLFCARI
tara:strand:+ start:839 stop:3367 length:2529 start_codon:yes stop_codon:yes gene_type:complete